MSSHNDEFLRNICALPPSLATVVMHNVWNLHRLFQDVAVGCEALGVCRVEECHITSCIEAIS